MYFSDKKDVVTIGSLDFVVYLSAREIQNRVRTTAQKIEAEYARKNPLFLIVLNGAFMFAADLIRNLDVACDVAFVKISSYKGLVSTGELTVSMIDEEVVKGRHVVIVEDIIDSGLTMNKYVPQLKSLGPQSVSICSLLKKKDAMKYPVEADYICFEIADKFVVGYGLDFDGAGRNLPHIYQLIDNV